MSANRKASKRRDRRGDSLCHRPSPWKVRDCWNSETKRSENGTERKKKKNAKRGTECKGESAFEDSERKRGREGRVCRLQGIRWIEEEKTQTKRERKRE